MSREWWEPPYGPPAKLPHPLPYPRTTPLLARLALRVERVRNRLRRWVMAHDVCLSCHGPFWPWVDRHYAYHADCKHALDAAWGRATARPVTCWECS